jgi:hypothetical protein
MSSIVIVDIMANTVAHARGANPFNTDGDFEDVGKNENRGNDELCRPREELEQAIARAANFESCTVFKTADEVKEYMRKAADEVSVRQIVS